MAVTENKKLRILLVADYNINNAAMVIDHINALHFYSGHDVYVLSSLIRNHGDFPDFINNPISHDGSIEFKLDAFDVIVIHYSMTLCLNTYISSKAKKELRAFNGLKALFIQDEYRFVNRTINVIKELGFELIFTCVPEDVIEKIYPSEILPGVIKVNVLTGYVPEGITLFTPPPLSKRKYDICYRGRKYPAWHGRMGLEKWKVAEFVKREAKKYSLNTDISYKEESRLYGVKWVEFLQGSKSTLGVESGCSVFDFDGSISAKTETFSALINDKELGRYEEVKEKYFGEHEDLYELGQISPRLFEAIALGTALILYEGSYSGVIKPWKHYLPLKKDHSNFQEIVSVLKNEAQCAAMIADAYADVVASGKYSYENFVASIFDENINLYGKCVSTVDFELSPKMFHKALNLDLVSNPHGYNPAVHNFVTNRIKPLVPKSIKNLIKKLLNRM